MKSRIYRCIVACTVAAWLIVLGLVLVNPGPEHPAKAVMFIMAMVATGGTMLCVLPGLLFELYDRKLRDYHGSFMAGWLCRGEKDPEDGERMRLVQGGRR